MNRPAVEKLLEHLKEQQKEATANRFNMRYFGVAVNNRESVRDMLEMPACNTQGCLAGEGVLANGVAFIREGGGIEIDPNFAMKHHTDDIEDAAVIVLGLSSDERTRLFYFSEWVPSAIGNRGWPAKFEDAYWNAKTPADRLQVAVNRVQHFLDTDGAE